MGMTALWVFHEKSEKKYMRAERFLEDLCFLTKYGHKSSVFLDNGCFSDKLWA